jgi:hypothetical protein
MLVACLALCASCAPPHEVGVADDANATNERANGQRDAQARALEPVPLGYDGEPVSVLPLTPWLHDTKDREQRGRDFRLFRLAGYRCAQPNIKDYAHDAQDWHLATTRVDDDAWGDHPRRADHRVATRRQHPQGGRP